MVKRILRDRRQVIYNYVRMCGLRDWAVLIASSHYYCFNWLV